MKAPYDIPLACLDTCTTCATRVTPGVITTEVRLSTLWDCTTSTRFTKAMHSLGSSTDGRFRTHAELDVESMGNNMQRTVTSFQTSGCNQVDWQIHPENSLTKWLLLTFFVFDRCLCPYAECSRVYEVLISWEAAAVQQWAEARQEEAAVCHEQLACKKRALGGWKAMLFGRSTAQRRLPPTLSYLRHTQGEGSGEGVVRGREGWKA